ncbi:uncharacterized protein M421DRAFT_129328 [Didymella exigua CBS 183.55]|uniref:Uncharacterized protein n=1 Tax=Didymella exigua CBS 183.55 TaxID=1150837 RepID=A0A6A5RWY9_9PLEO|nr:uncharacterized protein M421DRAFT_129328 [Didymella exigua CBS 183.55]KAF1929777.1 hypothetical protein M421DRAFT_129328 [Didymella exigua CBS 183.55]
MEVHSTQSYLLHYWRLANMARITACLWPSRIVVTGPTICDSCRHTLYIHALNQSCENGYLCLSSLCCTAVTNVQACPAPSAPERRTAGSSKRGGLPWSDSLDSRQLPVSPCISFILGKAEAMSACTHARPARSTPRDDSLAHTALVTIER